MIKIREDDAISAHNDVDDDDFDDDDGDGHGDDNDGDASLTLSSRRSMRSKHRTEFILERLSTFFSRR